MTTKRFMKTTLLATLVSAMLLAGLAPVAADITPGGGAACLPDGVVGSVTCNLWATTGTIALPGGSIAPVWGYSDTATAGTAQVPGPTIVVDEGDAVTINLTNNLSEDTALWLPQLPVTPDLTGIAAGGTTSYSFVASDPGTFLYEAGGATGPHQVAMGMSGAIVVVPTGGVVEDNEHLVAISELDLDLLNSATPATFDLRNYKPEYQIVNGAVAPAGLPVFAGQTVRLRYLNVGLKHHSIGLLGLDQHVAWMDGSALPAGGYSVVSESLAPGQTAETIVSIPTGVADGTQYALYEGAFLGGNGAFGGMLTYLEVDGTPPGGGGTPPVTTNTLATPTLSTDGIVVVTATITDPDAIGVTAAELFVDSTGADGTGIAPDAATMYTWTLTGLASGNHNVYVHGADLAEGWGTFAVASFRVDVDGPVVSALSASPNPSSGQVAVTLSATGSDSATGGSGITAAEYRIDGGAPSPMAVNPLGAPVASLDAVIPAVTMQGLADGPHTIDMRAQDSTTLWGDWTVSALVLDVDGTGPDTSAVLVRPDATNGFQGYTPTIQSIRVDATFTDTTSNIAAGEGFINTVEADGTGFPMTPADGLYNELSEDGYVYIPLTTIRLLGDGVHTIFVHGLDTSGNWGPTQGGTLTIESDIPTVTGTTVTPATTDTTVPVALTATATDATTDIVWAEWFAGADPGEGNGTDMTVAANGAVWDLAATIDTTGWAPGPYTISVRARDAAGNWSATDSTTLTVDPAPPTGPGLLDFSTVGNGAIPGVGGSDDADVYSWNSAIFSRILDGSALGLPGNADIDGLDYDAATDVYYISFNRNAGTNVPDPDGGFFVAQDEDVVEYDAENGEWQPFFDGVECLLDASNGRDIDALDVVGGNLYFSTIGNASVDGVGGPYDDADIYLWDGAGCSRIFDASVNSLPGAADIDGLTVVDNDTFYVSSNANITVPGFGLVEDEDVVQFDAGVWSTYFDGTAQGLTAGGQDLDAVNVR